MKVAAIDTSTRWCGVALVESGGDGRVEVIAEAGIHAHDSHSVRLLLLLEAVLAQAGWGRNAVDLYAAARGPGSFTGLRIGLGTIRGLAVAADRPCVGVGTLDAIAAAVGSVEAPRVPVMDAGRGEIYAARFDAGSFPPAALDAPWVGAPGDLPGRLGGPSVVFGPGIDGAASALAWPAHVRIGTTPTGIARAVGRLAVPGLAAGDASAETLAPLYVRPPDAATGRGPD